MKFESILMFIIPIIFSLQSCVNREGCSTANSFPGCKLPGEMPELFAPGKVSGPYQTRDVAISPDGKEIYFGVRISGYYTILLIELKDGQWSEPSVMQHMEDPSYMNIEPALSWDGNKFYFLSNRPLPGSNESNDENIWVMDRTGSGWSDPYSIGDAVNTEMKEFYPSLTKDGTVYFTRNDPGSPLSYIYRSRLVNGRYQEPEKLPEQVNCGSNQYNAFISPDESYIIVPVAGRDDSFGGTDYYIVFRDENDNWSEPQNMGDKINTPDTYEYSAYVTRDSRFMFFMSRRFRESPTHLSWTYLKELACMPESGNPSIYWIDASFIEDLREEAVFIH